MSVFSVWDQGKNAFSYYETGDVQRELNVEKPKHLVNRTLGSTIDQAAWPLPANARLVGMGSVAIGKIAVKKTAATSGLGDLGDGSLVKTGLLAVSAYLLYRYVVKAPRRRYR